VQRRESLIIVVVMLVLAVFIIAPTAAIAQDVELQPGTAMGRETGLPIKAEPSFGADTIEELLIGETVTVIEVEGTWAHVTFGDLDGWMVVNGLVNREPERPISEQDPAILEQNIDIGRRVVEELWGGGNATGDNVRDLYAGSTRLHGFSNSSGFTFSQGDYLTFFTSGLQRIWPDLEVILRHISATEDTVTVHFTAHGTFDAAIPRSFIDPTGVIQPTHEEGTWDFVIIARIEDDKIVEEWWFWNRELIEHTLGPDGVND